MTLRGNKVTVMKLMNLEASASALKNNGCIVHAVECMMDQLGDDDVNEER